MAFVTGEHLITFAAAVVDNVTKLFVRKEPGKGLSSNDFTADDREKLDGIAEEANAYVLPLAASRTRGGVKTGYTENGRNYPVRLDHEQMYVNVPWTDTTYGPATASEAGLMSAGDKEKLDGIEGGANCYEHPVSHPAAMIEQDSTHRFVSDAKQREWDAIYAQAVAYADRLIANLINGAPETLDTLGEIANAMRNNADVVTALQEAIGRKANEVELARVAFTGSYNDLADRPSALDGQDGAAAGFGTPTATVDAGTGTPSVTVTSSGPDTAKVFNFEFRNLKGQTGATGQPGPAGKDGGKGDTGATGADGTRGSMIYWGTGIIGTNTTATVFSGSGVSSALVNDFYLNTNNWNVYQCTTAGAASAAKWVYKGNIRGATGAAGKNATTTAVATASANGLMGKEMVTKLDSAAQGKGITFSVVNGILTVTY